MWTKPTADVKCPRGDCIHYSTPPDAYPCYDCTCNHKSSSLCRTFNYKPKGVTPIDTGGEKGEGRVDEPGVPRGEERQSLDVKART